MTVVLVSNDEDINSDKTKAFVQQNCKEMKIVEINGCHDVVQTRPRACFEVVCNAIGE